MKNVFLQIALLWLAFAATAQGQLTNSGNLTLHANAQVTFYGNFANNGTFVDSSQIVSFSGQSTVSGSSTTAFRNLALRPQAVLTLQRNLNIYQSVDLGSGVLKLNGYTFRINNSSATAIARTTGYIVSEQTDNSGKVTWAIGAMQGAYLFPFGTASGEYIPFTFQLTAGDAGRVSVATYPTNSFVQPFPSAPSIVSHLNNVEGVDNSHNVVRRFWQIDKDGPTGTANITFVATEDEVHGLQNLSAQRWNAATEAWDAPMVDQQQNSAHSVTVQGVSDFSPWILSTGSTGSSLPIELISFDAEAVDGDALLTWVTAMELDNDYFTLEKSKDGIAFVEVAQIDGAGTSLNDLHYHYTDTEPYEGLSYYRLKQTDFDGGFKYSPMRAVTFNSDKLQSLQVYPNPATGETLHLNFAHADGPVQVTMFDLLGHSVAAYQLESATHREISLPPHLAAGTYTIRVSAGGKHEVAKVMVVR